MPKIDNTLLDSDHLPVLFEGSTKGIDRSMASHLIQKAFWYDSLNFRFYKGTIKQIDSLKPFMVLDEDELGDVQVVTAINVNQSLAVLIALTPTQLYKLNPTAQTAAAEGGTNDPCDELWMRWAWFADATSFYYTNPANVVQKYIDGSGISAVVATGTKYGALYMVNFHSHLVLANLVDVSGAVAYPNRIAWSDVNDFTDFLPDPNNESDFFNLEDQAGNAPNGAMITGLQKLSNSLFIYTSTSIWRMDYVGLPNIMLVSAQVRDVGNYYPYSLASVLDRHYFIGAGGFYTFDGNSVQSFGERIWTYFRDDLHPHSLFRNKTHASIDYDKQEIVWYYCSKASSGSPDKAIIFNYVEGIFFPIEGRGVMSVQRSPVNLYTTIDQLTGDIASLTGTIDSLSARTAFSFVLYGTTQGAIVREVVEGDDLADVLPEALPFLVTGDIHYGSTVFFKEIERIRIDAYQRLGGSANVYLYGRYFLYENPPTDSWNVTVPYSIGARVTYEGSIYQLQVKKTGKLFNFEIVDGGSWSDPPIVTIEGGNGDPLPDGTFTAQLDSTPGPVSGIAFELDDPPTDGVGVGFTYAPTVLFNGTVANVIVSFDPPTAPGVTAGEWQLVGVGGNTLELFGTWSQDFTSTENSGWVTRGNHYRGDVTARVHRWKFEFTGTTNVTALQPQGVLFNCFEEEVYVSKSER